jgi:hypothetical protein
MGKKVVRVFLDSNVILSGLLSERGAPRIMLDLLSLGLPFLMGATGRYNLIEIERNLKKKMPDLLFLYKAYLPKAQSKGHPSPSPRGGKRLFWADCREGHSSHYFSHPE